MNAWKQLNSIDDWKTAMASSHEKPVLVFKHSTRCSISQMALDRFNRSWMDEDLNHFKPYYLDLIAHRDVSNAIAEDTGIEHQSPQAILLINGNEVLSETHQSIRLENFRNEIKKLSV